MSDAAYFSGFFELSFEAHTKHLRSIDSKRKCKGIKKKSEKEKEERETENQILLYFR